MRGCWGECVVAPGGGECVVALRGVRGFFQGVCVVFSGGCVVFSRGHVWFFSAGGCAWFFSGGGMCGLGGGVHRIRDTVNERAVRFLLECILVTVMTAHKRSLGRGNFSTGVCQSFCWGWGGGLFLMSLPVWLPCSLGTGGLCPGWGEYLSWRGGVFVGRPPPSLG